jgi:ribosomal protein S27E
MFRPGSKAYDVKCLSCKWNKIIIIRSRRKGIIGNFLDKFKLPFKCPKCGHRVNRKRNYTMIF